MDDHYQHFCKEYKNDHFLALQYDCLAVPIDENSYRITRTTKILFLYNMYL